MTEREIRRDLVVGFLTFLVIVIGGLGLFFCHKADRLEADRDAWKRTAQYWESSWARWAAQMDTLPPHGTAKPERGE